MKSRHHVLARSGATKPSRLIGYGIASLVLAMTGCSSGGARRNASALSTLPVGSCEAIQGFFHNELEKYADAVEVAYAEYQDEQWKVETADPNGSMDRMSKLFEKYQAIQYDQGILQQTLTLYRATQSLNVAQCPWKTKLVRAKELLETTILTDDAVIKKEKDNQDKQDALTKKTSDFRITIPGESEPVSEAIFNKKLASDDDRAERETLFKKYANARALKWIDWGFRDYVESHNAEAKLAGYKNYFEYRFFRNQLDLKNYQAMVKELKKKLAPQLRRVVKNLGKKYGIQKVEGWDFAYLRNKSAAGDINEILKDVPAEGVMDFAKMYYEGLGIDVLSYGFKMDLYPRPGKNTHAFAMGLVPPHVDDNGNVLPRPRMDIRFLANMKKPVQWEDISTVIHELGHAIHFAEIRQPLGIFRGFESVSTEAIAMTMERMADSHDYLEDALPKFTSVKSDALEPILQKQLTAARIEQAFSLMRQVFFSQFEYEIYKNPAQDYAKLWSKMFKEWFGVEVKPENAAWDIDHYVIAPVYVQNYAIGILMVEQIYNSVVNEFHTSYRDKAIGDKLRKVYFGPGLEFNYLDLTQHFTGAPLTASAALKLLEGL